MPGGWKRFRALIAQRPHEADSNTAFFFFSAQLVSAEVWPLGLALGSAVLLPGLELWSQSSRAAGLADASQNYALIST